MSETGPSAPNSRTPEEPRCPQCGCPRDAPDRFCRRCGQSFDPAGRDVQAAKAAGRLIVAQAVSDRRKWTKWLDTRWAVWLLLGSLGPFAFPVLWRSRRFTRLAKVVVTVLVTVLTAALIWALYVVVAMLVRQLQELYQLTKGF